MTHGGFAEQHQELPTERYMIEVGDVATRDMLRKLVDLMSSRQQEERARLSEQNIEALLGILLPQDPTPTARRELELANAGMRAEFLKTVACLTAADLSDMAGHEARNRSVTASRWKAQGKIFSVPFQRAELYPAFQFADGEPRPAMARVMAALPTTMSNWQRAFWFTSPNGWLGGDQPSARLADTEAVVEAAAREGQAIG